MSLSKTAYDDLRWWIDNVDDVAISNPEMVIATDASSTGWGAVLGNKRTRGVWNLHEQQLHINLLELKAILYGLTSLVDQRNTHVKIYIIAARLENHLNRELPPTQVGFRKSRGTRDQIANMRWIIEKAIKKNRRIFMVFIDYSKAFDCVDHNMLWNILEKMGFPLHIIHLIKNFYSSQGAAVKTDDGITDFFN